MAKKRRKYPELMALKGRITEKGATYRILADSIGIAVNTLSDKINGFYAFDGPEMEKIGHFLEIEPERVTDFFMPSYCKTQQKSA